MTRRRFLVVLLCASLVFGNSVGASIFAARPNQMNFVTIASGSVSGVYFAIGGGICRMLNKNSKREKVRCSVEATPATIFNINALRGGAVDFGIVQSDWAYHAYNGEGVFDSLGAMKKLRSVFSMHTESFTIVASAGSGIRDLQDLVGKRVNIGNPGSGMKATMEMVMRDLKWSKRTFKFASDLGASEQSQALCDNKVDAIIYVVGHVNGGIQEAASTCDIRMVSLGAEEVNSFIGERSYYLRTKIPGGLYEGVPDSVDTFGVKALLVSMEDTDEELVYKIVKYVMTNLENFKMIHPAMDKLTAQDMIPDDSLVPIHEGARRYYKEAGYIK